MGERGRVTSLNVSDGGVPKRPVPQAWIGEDGVSGDRQQDRVHHGGPDRAVCLYAVECIDRLRAEGHPIAPGTAGENVTVAGLGWGDVVPGRRLQIGAVLLEITSYTVPCRTICGSFINGQFSRISQKTNPGWSRVYARVLVPGTIRPGDPVDILDR